MITAGFDIGTRFVKVALAEKRNLLSAKVNKAGKDITGIIRQTYKQALLEAGVKKRKISRIVATGYGAHLVKKAEFTVTEPPCTARAAYILDPEIRTVVDVGNLFIQVATMDALGNYEDSTTNHRCAAGSGKFLELVAQAVEVPIEEISGIAKVSRSAYQVVSACAVFAESEVVTQVNQGTDRADIVSGVLLSIASRISPMLDETGAKEKIALCGGVSSLKAFPLFFEKGTGRKAVPIPGNPFITAAYGAALIAQGKSVMKNPKHGGKPDA